MGFEDEPLLVAQRIIAFFEPLPGNTFGSTFEHTGLNKLRNEAALTIIVIMKHNNSLIRPHAGHP